MKEDSEYTISMGAGGASVTVAGVLRLASPIAYKAVFQPLQDAIEARPKAFRIDLSKLVFLNSSGVTALSRLVMSARASDVALVVVVDDAVPWQRKTLSSLQRLYPKLELVTG